MDQRTRLYYSGVLVEPREGATPPPLELWEGKKNGLVVVECPQSIPCNPCHTSCPTGAIVPFKDINDVPKVDWSLCTGCGICVAACPGLACFVVDLATGDESRARLKLPFEFLPKPTKGEEVTLLNRVGEDVGRGTVVRTTEPLRDRTTVVHVDIPRNLANDVRAIRLNRRG